MGSEMEIFIKTQPFVILYLLEIGYIWEIVIIWKRTADLLRLSSLFPTRFQDQQ